MLPINESMFSDEIDSFLSADTAVEPGLYDMYSSTQTLRKLVRYHIIVSEKRRTCHITVNVHHLPRYHLLLQDNHMVSDYCLNYHMVSDYCQNNQMVSDYCQNYHMVSAYCLNYHMVSYYCQNYH